MLITPRPPMSTMAKVANGPKALTFCKGGVLTQLASSMMPSLMTNTQWLWVAEIYGNIPHTEFYHQWRSSNQDPQSGPKVSTSSTHLHFVIDHSVEFDQFSLLLGTPLPIPLYEHQMINWQNNLVVLGGETTGYSMCGYSSSCYLLECHNGELTWQELNAKMTKERELFVAIKISEEVAKTLTS